MKGCGAPLKYLIVLDRENNERAILFDEDIVHKDMARIHRARDNDIRVIAAGFCIVNKVNTVWAVSVYGRSDSMDMNGRPEDRFVIERLFTT